MSVVPPKGGYFPITAVHRFDVMDALFGKEVFDLEITDDDMLEIAEKMGEAYVDTNYWSDLKIIASDVLKDKLRI